MQKVDVVWLLADLFNGMMAIPNLIGLLFLSPVIVRETRQYFAMKDRSGKRPVRVPM